jgi:hypothetical protein
MDLSFAPETPTSSPESPLKLTIKIPSSFKALQRAALDDNQKGAILRAQIDGVPLKMGMKRRKSCVSGLDLLAELAKLDTPVLPQQKRAK